jgi:hypothetical protein
MVTEAINSFIAEISQYSPCLYQFKDGIVCGIAKLAHTTGHYGQKTGQHEGPSIPTNIDKLIVQRFKDLKEIV